MVGDQEHFDAGDEQEGAEQVEHPGELRDERRSQPDHDRAKHDHAEDAPEQHAMLVDARHREVGEDERDDENVVERQAFLKEEARQIGDAGFLAATDAELRAALRARGERQLAEYAPERVAARLRVAVEAAAAGGAERPGLALSPV